MLVTARLDANLCLGTSRSEKRASERSEGIVAFAFGITSYHLLKTAPQTERSEVTTSEPWRGHRAVFFHSLSFLFLVFKLVYKVYIVYGANTPLKSIAYNV